MATSMDIPAVNEVSENGTVQEVKDLHEGHIPTTPDQRRTSHRYSAFDTQLFSQFQPTSSPSQAKRALEAHLAETDRRLQEASKLGTSLVNQRNELSERLKEVEQQKNDREIGSDLRQKLVDIEKEYNEIGRDSARAFLAPKSRLVSAEDNSNGATKIDPVRSASPTKFIGHGTDSPTKSNLPGRKQRNQPANRVHDIEFAAEIGTSLLSQVRHLQGLLSENEENLKRVTLEKTQLELDVQNYSQRVRSMDENEQRYKDENWTLETQTHEMLAAAKESADREQKLQQSLAILTAEKNSAQRELDDTKTAHGKLGEEHTAFRRTHENELAGLRRNVSMADTDKASLQLKVEELTAQNQELAQAVAGSYNTASSAPNDLSKHKPGEFSLDPSESDHSPPPSPSKGLPRNAMLESETLKSSLHHAHRMIQTLKGNIHREKSEKLELKRLLQESRDELDVRRAEGGSKKARGKSQPEPGKKGLRMGQLGVGRNSRTDIELEDPEWEDHNGEASTSAMSTQRAVEDAVKASDTSDAYQTANETEDAFETANEKEESTETEAFQTGAESWAGDSSDDLTETEAGPARNDTVRASRPSLPAKRSSMISTASTTDGEDTREVKTPVHSTSSNLKYRLKMGRGSRRSRVDSEEPEGTPRSSRDTPRSSRDSPASFISNRGNKGQSLATELGDFGSEDEMEGSLSGTPSRPVSQRSTPARGSLNPSSVPPVPKIPMVSSAMMTEPWEPPVKREIVEVPVPTPSTPRQTHDQGVQGTPIPDVSKESAAPYQSQEAAVQSSPLPERSLANPSTPTMIASGGALALAADAESSLSTPGTSTPETADLLAQIPPSQELAAAGVSSVPVPAPQQPRPELSFSNIQSIETKPLTQVQLKERPTTAIHSQPSAEAEAEKEETGASDNIKEAASAGVIGSVFGWAMGKQSSTPTVAEDDTAQKEAVTTTPLTAEQPFKEISTNVMSRHKDPPKMATNFQKSDQGSQTLLSSEQIEGLLNKSSRSPAPTAVLPAPPLQPNGVKQGESPRTIVPPAKSMRRPGSSSSIRTSTVDMPPLPADHRQAIEAASLRTSGKDRAEGVMGPPLAPASAYRSSIRRPITPSEQQAGTPRSFASPTTPRNRYSSARSARSRRSSVSSFESELDARFNIRADGMTMHVMDGGTDPRMIQAITQTMIGEYLWKYTRRAGRGDMSTNRHRRFFWVHPYTRTLYWSDQDPSTAGRAQLKAKSVAIEAIRVVADDNPMPPGLHRKSIIVITPGREIKFTATTGQRHETWFNAMSYLLLRSNPDAQYPEHITPEDVAEFNPATAGYRRSTAASRASLSTYNSRANTTRRSRASSRAESPTKSFAQCVPQSTPQATPQAAPQAAPRATSMASTSSRQSASKHASMASRFSAYWRPGKVPDSETDTQRDSTATGSIHNPSVANDSAEDVRQVLEKQDQDADNLENVRACCDGKHDVSSLNRRSGFAGRMGSTNNRHSHQPHTH